MNNSAVVELSFISTKNFIVKKEKTLPTCVPLSCRTGLGRAKMFSDEPVGIRSTKWGIHKDKLLLYLQQCDSNMNKLKVLRINISHCHNQLTLQ